MFGPVFSMADHDAITTQQVGYLKPLLRGLLSGSERTALDYGCGAGRLTRMLAELVGEAVGFDPCREFIALAPTEKGTHFLTTFPIGSRFDVVFTWSVLGGLGVVTMPFIARSLAEALSDGGLLLLADHMGVDCGLQWQFRPAKFYVDLFAQEGIWLKPVGRSEQCGHEMTILAGRKSDDRLLAA